MFMLWGVIEGERERKAAGPLGTPQICVIRIF